MKRINFCDGWRFGGEGRAPRDITLPHDAMLGQGRAADAPSGAGCAYFLGGRYGYSKTFPAPEEWRLMDILAEFDGVYPMARVYLNGREIGGCAYGYSRFRVPLEGLRYGRQNTLTVYVDNADLPNTRWYSGAGIYRPAWLLALPKTHILPDGLRVTTLSHDPARVRVETRTNAEGARVRVEILDGERMTASAATPEADEATAPLFELMDICGYNYASSRYAADGEAHPDRVIVGSETFPQDLAANWRMVERYPWLTGDFMWTAWDYLGEVGLGAWTYEPDGAVFNKPFPWLLADCGAFDILGNPGAEAGLARAVWNRDAAPFIAVVPVNRDPAALAKAMWRGSNALPHWSWTGCEGRPAVIEVYSPAHSVELLLNGESLGRKALTDCKAVFETAYAPGELVAVAYNADGSVHSESALRSADGDLRLAITPESDGELIWLDVSLRGKNGEIECGREAALTLEAEGGELLGFGSANPRASGDFLSGRYATWYGRAQAVIRRRGGRVRVRAFGDGFSAEREL